jgi:hypothetical protein
LILLSLVSEHILLASQFWLEISRQKDYGSK